jgi:hypothetical protein
MQVIIPIQQVNDYTSFDDASIEVSGRLIEVNVPANAKLDLKEARQLIGALTLCIAAVEGN